MDDVARCDYGIGFGAWFALMKAELLFLANSVWEFIQGRSASYNAERCGSHSQMEFGNEEKPVRSESANFLTPIFMTPIFNK
jgi:hypothetical protein